MSEQLHEFREPPPDYRPAGCARLQPHDPVGGTLWVGTHPGDLPRAQFVWAATEDFRRYVNRLLNACGHLTYGELAEIAEERERTKR